MTHRSRRSSRGARVGHRRCSARKIRRLLTGRGRYVDDVVVPGMLHVAFAAQ